MKFQYSEKKVKLPGNVHAYAEKKVMKLARFFEEDAEALIVFSVEKNQNNVELTVHGAGTWFRASESTSDMFASIDAAVATIEGQIRSFNNREPVGRRLILCVYALSLTTTQEPMQNEAVLTGTVCKPPVYRQTPLGRQITDLCLAVPRLYRRTDYIPCILWGRTAMAAAEYPIGTELTLTGRLQSRTYLKNLGETSETRTAYELSVSACERIAEPAIF